MPSAFSSPYLNSQGANPYTGDPNAFLQRTYGALPSLSPKRFSGKASGQVVWDQFMGYIDTGSGLPFSGQLGSGKFVINGKVSDTDPNAPPKPPPDFERVPLYPELGDLLPGLTKQVTSTATFNPYELATAQKTANTTALKAYTDNTNTFTAGLNTDRAANEAELRGELGKFAETNARQTKATQEAIERLAANAAATNANIQARANLASSRGGSVARFDSNPDTRTTQNAATAPRIARALFEPLKEAEFRMLGVNNDLVRFGLANDTANYQNEIALQGVTRGLVDKFYGDKVRTLTTINDKLNFLASLPPAFQEQEAALFLRSVAGEQALQAGQLANLTAVQQLRVMSEFLKRNIPEPATVPLNSYPVGTPRNLPPAPGVSMDDLMRLLAERGEGPLQAPMPAMPPGYVSRGNPIWDRQFGYMPQPGVEQRVSWGGPNDGGGQVNGTYLGTDAWRNTLPIPAQDVNPYAYAGWA